MMGPVNNRHIIRQSDIYVRCNAATNHRTTNHHFRQSWPHTTGDQLLSVWWGITNWYKNMTYSQKRCRPLCITVLPLLFPAYMSRVWTYLFRYWCGDDGSFSGKNGTEEQQHVCDSSQLWKHLCAGRIVFNGWTHHKCRNYVTSHSFQSLVVLFCSFISLKRFSISEKYDNK